MKMEKLKKDNRKEIITIVSIVVLLVIGILGFVGTRAKYKYTAEYPLVSGTIHYKSGDLSVLAVNLENESGEFSESDNIPSEGYILNREKSYCGLSNGDGTYSKLNDITITYENSKVTVSNLSQRGTKCFLYFNKINYLVASIQGADEIVANDVLGKKMARSSFESITIVANKNVPSNAIESWDVSEKHNGSVMAWYTDANNNGLYELYIGEDGGVIANSISNGLFAFYTNVTNVDLGNLDTSNVTTMAGMFYQSSSLTSLDLSSFNTSNVIDMFAMFKDTVSLTNLNISSFDTKNVFNMQWMFYNMTSLTNLNLSNFDTSNVTNMYGMFKGMTSITDLNLGSFDTSKVTKMGLMFNGTSLTNLDLSHFNTSSVTAMEGMFQSMPSLTNLNISNFDTSHVTDMGGMFGNTTSLQTLNLNKATFDNVTSYSNMFTNSNVQVITVKDTNAENFINARLSEAGKTAMLLKLS